MIALFVELLIGGTLLFIVPPLIPPQLRVYHSPSIVRVLGVICIIFSIASTSYVNVSDKYVAQAFRVFGGTPLSGGKIIAVNGENGPQGWIYRPGFHFSPLINILFTIDTSKAETKIPDGKVGVLMANDGVELRAGQVFADPFPTALGLQMLDAETFLKNGGQRGPQLTVLMPGTYVLNDYLWKVDIQPATEVHTGFVGVIKSNVHASIDFGTLKSQKPENCSVIKSTDTSEGRIEAPRVPVGCVGVWLQSLQPGKYNFNPAAFSVTEFDTRAQVWTYAGGYTRRAINLEVDSKGEIKQLPAIDQQIPFDAKNDADRAIFVKMEGWDIPLELRVVAQVSPEKASCVVAGVGTLKEVEDRVLTPSIRAITRDVAGGTYEVEEIKVDEKSKPILDSDGKPVIMKIRRPTRALDLINQRPLIESEIERRIRPEAEKSCVSIREVRLGEPAIPPELLVAVRREQLATQLGKAFEQEQQAQNKRIASEQARETASQQGKLVSAQIGVKASEQNALAARNEGQGEKEKLTLIAEGQKAQMDVLGVQATVDLRKFELALGQILGYADKHSDVLVAALTNATKFVPNVQVSGSSGDSGLLGTLSGLLGSRMIPANDFVPLTTPATTSTQAPRPSIR